MKSKFLVLGLVAAGLIVLSGCVSNNNPNNPDIEEIELFKNKSTCLIRNDIHDCLKSALYYYESAPKHLSVRKQYLKDKVKQLIVSYKGCESKNATLCYLTTDAILSAQMETTRDDQYIYDLTHFNVFDRNEIAQLALHRACDLNDAESCYKLAFYRDKGTISCIKQNVSEKEAIGFYEKACNLNNKYCAGLVQVYLYGNLHENINRGKAKFYANKTCSDLSNGDKREACDLAKILLDRINN